jgi:hypothetical protein
MRTFENRCAPSNNLRTFGRAVALGYPLAGAVPLTRKVAQIPASASIACPKRSIVVMESLPLTNLIQNPKSKIAKPRREGPAGK